MKKRILIFLIIIILGLGFFVIEARAGSEHNVYGWAWSENIGWISFNSTNCDPGSDRADYTGPTNYLECGAQGSNYGVHIDPDTGLFSGGAWSSNIGWISFGDFDGDGDIDDDDKNISDFCAPNCEALFDFDTKQVSGWARALAPVSVEYEGYEEFDDLSGGDFGKVYGNRWEAGKFTSQSQHQINYVSLILARWAYSGDDIGDVIVSIQGVSYGEPNGVDICQAVIDGNSLPLIDRDCPTCSWALGYWPYDASDVWTDIFLGECNLAAGTRYAIVVRAPDAEQAPRPISNRVYWYYDDVGGAGNPARRLYSTDSGITWADDEESNSYFFQTWKGDPLAEPFRPDPPTWISGGWDGWIKLRGNIYGVWLDTDVSPPYEFRDWAWGGDDTPGEAVIGWVSFNCADRGTCGSVGVDYKVMTGLAFNEPPSAVNLNVEQTSGCSSAPIVRFTWDYSDDDNLPLGTDPQSAYEIQISDAGGLITTLNGGSATFRDYSPPSFGTTYSWSVRVQDTNGPIWSGPIDGPSITPRRWPEPDFTWCPDEPFMNEPVQFCSIFEAGVCELGICSNMAGPADNLTTCAAGCSSWEWDFGDGIGTSTQQNPSYAYSVLGSQNVRLTVTDFNNKSCSETKPLSTKIPLPTWWEIPPF